MNCLLLGSTGFIGAHCKKHLAQAGHAVIAPRRQEVDWASSAFLQKLIEEQKIDALINCIGIVNGTPKEMVESNITTVKTIIQACEISSHPPHLIHLSSVKAIQQGGLYGELKNEADRIIQSSKIKSWTILRPTLVYGKNDKKNVGSILRWIRYSYFIPVPKGRSIKVQPLYVDDLTAMVLTILGNPKSYGRTLTLSGLRQVPLVEIVEVLLKLQKKRRVVVPISLSLIQKIFRKISRLPGTSKLPLEQIMTLHEHPPFESKEAIKAFGFSPREFKEGAATMLSDH